MISPIISFSQSSELLKIRDYRIKNEHEIMRSFNTLLGIPNIAADITNIKLNAAWIATYMQSKNISNVQLLTPNTPNKPPVVYGEVLVPGAKETIIFYAHYDGQPVDSTKWLSGLHPFKPQLVSNSFDNKGVIIPWPNANTSFDPMWRIYGRGASDDKAGVMAIINGYAALASANIAPSVNIKFFFEGEEEAGSTHLQEIL